MAIVNGNVLGNLRGKLGNLSARTVEGKTILAARPSSFNVNYDPSVVEVRQKFVVTANLAKNIFANPTLSEIWKNLKENGISVFNTIFKKNFQYSAVDKPTLNNIITPDGFNPPVTSALVNASRLTVELNALDSAALISTAEKSITLVSLVVYHNPISPDDEAYKIIKLSKDELNFDYSSAYSVTVDLDVIQQAVAAKYQNKIIYVALASKDVTGKIIQYSATYSHNG
ncbi:MAG: hypothetical protein IPH62_09710 [Ignavibacteriae bacterium]|nr:hypothetical protein [Ignavibacteriota bacterium]